MVIALSACHAPMPQPMPEPDEAAQLAFREAREAVRDDGDWGLAMERLQSAERLAPEWAAPRRLRDDLRQSLLQGPAVLRERWLEYQAGGEPQVSAYLIGRMLGVDEGGWFEHATRLNGSDPWAWHGRAFEAGRTGRKAMAKRWQKEALRLAREPFEFGLFSGAMARLQAGEGDTRAALRTLQRAMDLSDSSADRLDLQVQSIVLANRSGNAEAQNQAQALARQLLRDPNLPGRAWAALIEASVLPASEMAALLLDRSDPEGQRMALEMLGSQTDELRAALAPGSVQVSRVQRFARGECVQAVQAWIEALPVFLQPDHAGSRVSLTRWKRLLQACQRWQDDPVEGRAMEVCERLLAVGWLEEAQAFARFLPAGLTLEEALVIEKRTGLARTSLRRLRGLLRDLDRGDALWVDPVGGQQRKVRELEDLLHATAQILFDGRVIDEAETLAVLDSPRLRVSQFAQVVHPGPVAAPWDEAWVPAGEPIPGLAQALGRLGRIGIFGAALGVPPDGTILRLIDSEVIQGEHLGVPFHGTVLWCDGADVGGRAMRMGGSVAGAALHEGYYVDVAELRDTLEYWDAWQARWENEWRREQYRAGLEDPGVPVEFLRSQPAPKTHEGPVFQPSGDPWYNTDWLLGQSDRMRLALLIDRGEDGELGKVTLDEVSLSTAIHEEGHLMERTRFLPLHKNWTDVLGFAASQGFSPVKIQERLEYRAQLVALCIVEEPRLALVDILDQAQTRGSGMPHAGGYKALLGDLLRVLGEGARADASWLEGWRPDEAYLLAHQLHRVPPRVLRAAGLHLAHEMGLDRH